MTLADEFSGGVGPWGHETGADLEALRQKFLHFRPVSERDGLFGMLVWKSNDKSRNVDLEILDGREMGVSLLWMGTSRDGTYSEHHTVHDATKLKREHWFDTGGQEWALIGTFLPVEQAWWVIEDFFANPMELSPRVEWIDIKKLPRFPM